MKKSVFRSLSVVVLVVAMLLCSFVTALADDGAYTPLFDPDKQYIFRIFASEGVEDGQWGQVDAITKPYSGIATSSVLDGSTLQYGLKYVRFTLSLEEYISSTQTEKHYIELAPHQSFKMPVTFYFGGKGYNDNELRLKLDMLIRAQGNAFDEVYYKYFTATRVEGTAADWSMEISFENPYDHTVYVSALGFLWDKGENNNTFYNYFGFTLRSASYRYLSPSEVVGQEIMYGWDKNPIPPAGSEKVDELGGLEDALFEYHEDTLNDIDNTFGDTLTLLVRFQNAFMAVSSMLNAFFGIDFFSFLLSVSIVLGLIYVLFNLGSSLLGSSFASDYRGSVTGRSSSRNHQTYIYNWHYKGK